VSERHHLVKLVRERISVSEAAPARCTTRHITTTHGHKPIPEDALVALAMAYVRAHGMDPWGIHGVAHWWRVRHNGMLVAQAMGARPHVVTMFAILHDSHRHDDLDDPDHGPRAAEWLLRVRGASAEHVNGDMLAGAPLNLKPADVDARIVAPAIHVIRALDLRDFDALVDACRLHTQERTHPDPTVAACFVADRLDLSRVGYRPDTARMPALQEVLTDAFIDAAMERERRGLDWPGGQEIREAWNLRM